MPDTQRQEQHANVTSDEVNSLLEGLGQAFREWLLEKNLVAFLVKWIALMGTGWIAISGVKSVLNRDPKWRELDAELRGDFLEQLTEHLDHFIDRGARGLGRIKEDILKKAWAYLTKHDSAFAESISAASDKVSANTAEIRTRRRGIHLHPRTWRLAFGGN